MQSQDATQGRHVHAVPGQDPKSARGEGEGRRLVQAQWLSRPLASNDETNNQVCWKEACQLSQCAVPGAATQSGGTASPRQLKGQPVSVLCTVLLLPEDKDDGGDVLGDVVVAMDSSQSSPTEQWYALGLSPNSSQPRVLHPAPLVEIQLRLAYERAPRQLGSPGLCARTPRATSPRDEADNGAAGGGAVEPMDALEVHDDKSSDAAKASLTPRQGKSTPRTGASLAGTTPAHAAGMSVWYVSVGGSLLSAWEVSFAVYVGLFCRTHWSLLPYT